MLGEPPTEIKKKKIGLHEPQSADLIRLSDSVSCYLASLLEENI